MEISPEKSQTMSFLEEDPVRIETIVGKKCLQQAKNFKYLGCEISYENEKDIEQKMAKFTQIPRILNNTFKPTLVQIFSRIKVFNTLALPNLSYGREIWTLRKKKKRKEKKIHTEMEFFRRTAWKYSFCPQKEWGNFERGESGTSSQETIKIQIKLAMTCKKNEQQQDAKNNAEL